MPMTLQHCLPRHKPQTSQAHICILIRNSCVVEQRGSGLWSLSAGMGGLTTEWPWARSLTIKSQFFLMSKIRTIILSLIRSFEALIWKERVLIPLSSFCHNSWAYVDLIIQHWLNTKNAKSTNVRFFLVKWNFRIFHSSWLFAVQS